MNPLHVRRRSCRSLERLLAASAHRFGALSDARRARVLAALLDEAGRLGVPARAQHLRLSQGK
jgi:hypothetical protein